MLFRIVYVGFDTDVAGYRASCLRYLNSRCGISFGENFYRLANVGVRIYLNVYSVVLLMLSKLVFKSVKDGDREKNCQKTDYCSLVEACAESEADSGGRPYASGGGKTGYLESSLLENSTDSEKAYAGYYLCGNSEGIGADSRKRACIEAYHSGEG